MRRIRSFDRPAVQWALVASCTGMTLLAATEAVMVRRLRVANVELHGAALNAKLDRQQLELTLNRERSAREALSLEVFRRGSTPPPVPVATLTLEPLQRRGSRPPAPTIDQPSAVIVELRLRLPGAPDPRVVSYAIAMRDWSTGQPVWSRAGLPWRLSGDLSIVRAALTADVLKPGAYEIALTGTTADGQAVEVASYDAGVRAAR